MDDGPYEVFEEPAGILHMKPRASFIRPLTVAMANAGILSDVPGHEYQLQVLLPALGRLNNG